MYMFYDVLDGSTNDLVTVLALSSRFIYKLHDVGLWLAVERVGIFYHVLDASTTGL